MFCTFCIGTYTIEPAKTGNLNLKLLVLVYWPVLYPNVNAGKYMWQKKRMVHDLLERTARNLYMQLGPQSKICCQSHACNCPQEQVTRKSPDQDTGRFFQKWWYLLSDFWAGLTSKFSHDRAYMTLGSGKVMPFNGQRLGNAFLETTNEQQSYSIKSLPCNSCSKHENNLLPRLCCFSVLSIYLW